MPEIFFSIFEDKLSMLEYGHYVWKQNKSGL